MLYSLARPLLFALDPETAHGVTLAIADAARATGLLGLALERVPARPVEAMGLEFPNPVGLAAGLDKNAAHIDTLAALGFGFIEVGTVTPRPQPGNERPRLFRITAAQALINRFGFNNVGLDRFLANVGRARWHGVLGINIGKNFDTPVERAADDYATCLDRVHAAASYVAVNVSSPNTRGVRALQDREALEALLGRLAGMREALADRDGRRVPLALKVSPDLNEAQIGTIADAVRRFGFDALIATNTSMSREGVLGMRHAREPGGLSGLPIRERATNVLRAFAARLGGEVTLIGVGGIATGYDAAQRFAAGAKLLQLYTGLVYCGPELIAECVRERRKRRR